MRPVLIALALLGVAACNAKEEAEIAAPKAAPPAAPTIPTGPDGAPLFIHPVTQDGWADLKIGMTHDQAVAALGGKVAPDTSTKDADWQACHMIQASVPEGLWVMVENGKVTRITLREEARMLRTDAGVRVGDPMDRVLETYPNLLKREPHKYQEPPAEYLTWWAKPDVSGIRYSIGEDRTVEEIHAGGPSIRYVEGCA